jgi:hypothetical protein
MVVKIAIFHPLFVFPERVPGLVSAIVVTVEPGVTTVSSYAWSSQVEET